MKPSRFLGANQLRERSGGGVAEGVVGMTGLYTRSERGLVKRAAPGETASRSCRSAVTRSGRSASPPAVPPRASRRRGAARASAAARAAYVGSMPRGVPPSPVTLTASSSKRRAWMIARSAGPRCSRLRSTIGPMLSWIARSCTLMPSMPGEALGLLDLAVEQVVVPAVADGAERRRIDVERPVTEPALQPVLRGEGRSSRCTPSCRPWCSRRRSAPTCARPPAGRRLPSVRDGSGGTA